MRRLFVDSFYFLALLNPGDAAHTWAVEFAEDFDGQFVTATSILIDVADALSHPSLRHLFSQLSVEIAANSNIVVVALDDELYTAGSQLYRTRPDKDWSLTDCISFVVMRREGITEALTGDHDFEQAGFVALLK